LGQNHRANAIGLEAATDIVKKTTQPKLDYLRFFGNELVINEFNVHTVDVEHRAWGGKVREISEAHWIF